MRVLLLISFLTFLTACGGETRGVDQSVQSGQATGPLAFLQGPWCYFDIDWGFELVWEQQGNSWIGEGSSYYSISGQYEWSMELQGPAPFVARTEGKHPHSSESKATAFEQKALGPNEIVLIGQQSHFRTKVNEEVAFLLGYDPKLDQLIMDMTPESLGNPLPLRVSRGDCETFHRERRAKRKAKKAPPSP